jgi:hypothetical protein
MSDLVNTAKATGGTSFDTAKCTGGRKIHPFDKNDLPNSGIIYEHTMTQAKTEYQPLALDLPMTGINKPTGSPFADDANAFSVGDSEPSDSGNGLVTFTRTFSQVPASYTDQIGLITRATPQIESPVFSPRDYQYNSFYTEDSYHTGNSSPFVFSQVNTNYTYYDYGGQTADGVNYYKYGGGFNTVGDDYFLGGGKPFYHIKWGQPNATIGDCDVSAYSPRDVNSSPSNSTHTSFIRHTHPFGHYKDFSYLSNARYKIYAENKATWDSVGDDVSSLTPVINASWSNYTDNVASSSWYSKTVTNTIANTDDLQLRVVVTADKLEGYSYKTYSFYTSNNVYNDLYRGKYCAPFNHIGTVTTSYQDTDFSAIDYGVGLGSICQVRKGRDIPAGAVIKYQSQVDSKYNMVNIGGLNDLRLIQFGGGKLEAISEPISIYKSIYNANTNSTSQSVVTTVAFGDIKVDGNKAFTDSARFSKVGFDNLGIEFGGTAGTDAEPEINVPAEATYTFIKTDQPENIELNSKLQIPTTLNIFSNPSIGEYLALTRSKQKIQSENEFIERYMGNIYKKTSIKSPVT